MKPIVKLTSLIIPMMLSACTFVPGMHMRDRGFTPSVNNQNQVVTPKVQEITPTLIQQQQFAAQEAEKVAALNYKSPIGFTVKTQGYHYLIGPQDVIQVIVWDHPNLSNPMNTMIATSGSDSDRASGITVDADGNIFYPYVGVVHVGGLTTDQIRDVLTQKLSVYIKDPQLNVSVVGFNSQKIDITGAVRTPTVIPITNIPMTVLNAVTLAGGPLRCGISIKSSEGDSTTCADVRDVMVTHQGVTTLVNLDSLKAADGSSNNWVLYDGDEVFVPNNNFYRVFILGAVNGPGPYNMIDNRMTLKEAIGDAGGVSDISDPTYTYVIRNYQHNPEIYEMDARSPDALNLAGDFALKPEDVVFISTSKLENFNSIINQFLPGLSTAVYIKSLST